MEETSTTSTRGQRLKSWEREKKPAGIGCYKRNSRVKIANTLKDDGYAWKKSGNRNAKFNRYYYKCAHKDEGCGALKHVQKLEDGSGMFRITYIGSHTCQNMNENTHMLSDSKIPPERSPFGSDTEKTSRSEGGKRLQPGSSSKRRKLVKAGSNVVVNISSENSHESPVEKDDAAVQSCHDTGPRTGNVYVRRRGKKIVLSEAGESSKQDMRSFLRPCMSCNTRDSPYIVELSQCADRSLNDLRALEPIGLEHDGDEVAFAAGCWRW